MIAQRSRATILLCAALAACAHLALAQPERLYPRPLSVNPLYAEGFVLYEMKCAACHGERGDGRGPVAALLAPRPADFTRGVFKLRSTPSGCLPLDSDLARTIAAGVSGTAMRPFHADLSAAEMRELVALVKGFAARFATEGAPGPVALPPEPGRSAELILRGREVFARERCDACHGDSGRGDGPLAAGLTDERGFPTRPRDLTMAGGVKAGTLPSDLFRSITTGLDGTPMHDLSRLSEQDRWALVYYLTVLAERPAPDVKLDDKHVKVSSF